MKVFPKFKKKHSEVINPKPVSSACIEKYTNKLPDNLIHLWQADGFAGYYKGLLWTIDPTLYKKFVKLWVHKDFGGQGIPIMRTAFADLIIWHDKPFGDTITLINTRYQKTKILGNDLDNFFELKLCDNEYLPYILMTENYPKIIKKLGTINRDECYGYDPILALNGNDSIANLKIFNFKDHLTSLTKALPQKLDSPD